MLDIKLRFFLLRAAASDFETRRKIIKSRLLLKGKEGS